MNEEQAKRLREPFPPELVGKLPRVWCKACRESPRKVCSEHSKSKCGVCGNNITSAHLHLDYVGHAAVTDRLLSVDPGWTWEPLARDPNTGAPAMIPNQNADGEPLGLWGYLKIGDVTKPAFGGGKNAKECISDMIRNGAMRFGVGLDLWSKEDLHAIAEASAGGEATPISASPEPASSPPRPHEGPKAAPPPAEELTPEDERKRMAAYWDGLTPVEVEQKIDAATAGDVLRLMMQLEGEREARKKGKPRKTVLAHISQRIRVLEPGPEAEPDADAGFVPAPPEPQTGGPGNGVEPEVTAEKLKAALAFIQEQPSVVDNAHAWTVPGVLLGLTQRGVAAGSLEEVPSDGLEMVWGAIPDGVRSSVDSLGPESLAKLAAQAT